MVSRCAPVIAKMCVARSTSAEVSGWLGIARCRRPLPRRLDGMKARRLAADRVYAGGRNFDVLAIPTRRGKALRP